MYVVTGVTGKVGGQVASALLASGHGVRAVMRDEAKAREWRRKGAEVALASFEDTEALAKAFRDAEAVFLMTPPNYDPEEGFPETKLYIDAIHSAIEVARPGKLVYLSTVGAQVTESNLLVNSGMTETMLRTVATPVAFLRAAWFLENAAWDLEDARGGIVHSFLQPLDHRIPMVATADIAMTAVELLQESWKGLRIVELEGPQRYSANHIAEALAEVLGRDVESETVPRETWENLFRSQGMRNPVPRMRMLDGFNEGWIDFEYGSERTKKGTTTLTQALQALTER